MPARQLFSLKFPKYLFFINGLKWVCSFHILTIDICYTKNIYFGFAFEGLANQNDVHWTGSNDCALQKRCKASRPLQTSSPYSPLVLLHVPFTIHTGVLHVTIALYTIPAKTYATGLSLIYKFTLLFSQRIC